MKKVIISSMIGNGLEWFEFALYGNFVTIIGSLFFSSLSPMVQLLAAFSVFASGYLMRPLGAILFGYIGDMMGRKTALSLAIMMMSIPTACIGILPTYDQIGVTATILLVVIRLVQGLSLGGEFSGSIAFLVEHAPKKYRGIAGSTAMISMNIGILVGTSMGMLLNKVLTPEQFLTFGWRIPFLMGIFIGFVGFYIRSKLHESPLYLKAKATGKISASPMKVIFKKHTDKLIIGIALYITVCVPFHTQIIFFKAYMERMLNYSFEDALFLSFLSIVVTTITMPLCGYLSDHIGRYKVLAVSCVGFILLTYPVCQMLHSHDLFIAGVGVSIFGLLIGGYMAPMPATLAELFPVEVRYTGLGLSFNISVALFGGTLPAIATELIHVTADTYFIAYYIILMSVITFAVSFYKKKHMYDMGLQDTDQDTDENSSNSGDSATAQVA